VELVVLTPLMLEAAVALALNVLLVVVGEIKELELVETLALEERVAMVLTITDAVPDLAAFKLDRN
jgi:hypothetical protein